MKTIHSTIVSIILLLSISACSESDTSSTSEQHNSLKDRIHAQMDIVEEEMSVINNTDDPDKRKELIATHKPNMEQLLAMYKQLSEDRSEDGSGGQSAAMVDIMVSQLRLYESIMKDIEQDN